MTNILNKITQITNDISSVTTNFTNEFNTIKIIESKNYQSERETYRKEFDKEKENISNVIKTKIDLIETETKQLISTISNKVEEAKKLVNIIGNIGVTGNYQKIADKHKFNANAFRIIALIFMTTFSGLLIYTIWDISSTNYDVIKSIIRIIAAAALSYPATYATIESSKHRKLETLNRKLELELASLGPFIEFLDEKEKSVIKTKLVEKYFGNNVSETDKNSKDDDFSISGFEKIVKTLLPFLNK